MCEPMTTGAAVGSFLAGQSATAIGASSFSWAATMPYIMAALAAGTTVAAQNQASKGQEAVAKFNQKATAAQAKDAAQRGALEEERHRAKMRQVIGAQRAAMGGSGAVVDEGTFGDILFDTAQAGEMDSQMIRYNASAEAYGAKMQGLSYGMEASGARTARRWNTAGSLMTMGRYAYGAYGAGKKK